MKHARTRWMGLAVVATLLGGALAGCGGSVAPPETAPPPGPAGAPASGPTGAPPPGAVPPGAPPPGTGGAVPGDPRLTSQPADGLLSTGWRYRFDLVSPANENNAIRERAVDLYFWPDTTRVWFQLQNRVGQPLKILWNEFRFRDTDNRVFKVVHEGIPYERRNDPLDYTLVSGNQRYSDWFAPVDLLEDPTAAQGGGMRRLFPTDGMAASFVGKTFGATFVLEIDGLPKQYDLIFKIQSVIPPR